MLRVGLTGGIACGKSHVLRELTARGCHSIDLDRVAHDVMEPGGPGYAPVVAAFGPGIIGSDARIDRKALGARVFADAAALARLNAIVHPLVRREEQRRLGSFDAADAIVVTDAALLVEAGMHLRYDRLVVVHCLPELQLQRLVARDGLSRAEAETRVASQLSLAEKRRFGHWELDTSGSLADTDAAARALASELQDLARLHPAPVVVDRDWLTQDGPGAALPLRDDGAGARDIDLFSLAILLGRPQPIRWLADGEGDVAPALALLRPVVAFCLARRGEDLESLGIAARSLARAATADAPSVAAVCARAFELQRGVVGRSANAADAAAFGVRWGGALPRGLAPG